MLMFLPCHLKTVPNLAELYHNFEFAQRAKPGRCVLVKDKQGNYGLEKIYQLKPEAGQGIFAPITSQGTILVNGIVTSCYSSVESQYLQHGMHQLFEKLWHIWDSLFGGSDVNDGSQGGIPPVLKLFLYMTEAFVPDLTL